MGGVSAEADVSGVRIDRAEALRYLGYAGQEIDPALRVRFEQLVCACEREMRPACVHATFIIDEARSSWEGDDAHVALVGCSFVLDGRDIAAHLRGACKAALMACTLGAASERELRKHAALGPTDGLLYDAAASALVEAAADRAEAAIVEEAASQGLRTNCRYSPGYGDFPLTVQPAFLAALDAPRRLGLVATEDHLLVPTKSITAVVGLFDSVSAGAAARSGCSSCRLRLDCHFRKKGITCYGR